MLSPPPALTSTPGFRSNCLAVEAAKFLRDLFAFVGGGSVTPQFGGTNHLAGRVQRHKPMLLAANANRLDLRSHSLGLAQRPADSAAGCVSPGVRMLLLCAGWQI